MVALLTTVATVGVDEAVFRELGSPEGASAQLPDSIHDAAVAGEVGTVLLERFGGLELRSLEDWRLLDLDGFKAAGATAVAQSADGRVQVVGYSDGAIAWRTTGSAGTEVYRILDPRAFVSAIALSPDARLAICGSESGTVLIFDLEAGRILHNVAFNKRGQQMAVAISSDGALFAAGAAEEGLIHCWQADSGRSVAAFELRGVRSLSFSPDAKSLLATSNTTESIHAFDLPSGDERWVQEHPANLVFTCVLALPDGKTAVAGDVGGRLRVFDLGSGELLDAFDPHSSAVSALQLSPESDLLYVTSYDGRMSVWPCFGESFGTTPIRCVPVFYSNPSEQGP